WKAPDILHSTRQVCPLKDKPSGNVPDVEGQSLAHFQRSGWLGHQVVYRETVGSTNDLALELVLEGAGEGLVVLADEQSAGRGRLNRRWSAPPGTCLLMSLVFHPQSGFQDEARRITMACGLALRDAICENTGVPVWLKWPNDVIVTRESTWAKVAGMLSEVGLIQGNPAVLVVGIGLNVNVPAETLSQLSPNAASLQVEAGRWFDRSALLDAFLSLVELRVAALRSGVDVLDAWRDAQAWMGRSVVVTLPTGAIMGIAESVDEDGALILRLPDGSTHRAVAGDVSLRLAAT
ncbi:MAG: biotin--[acetyl-CoA-carboxylase] ligase, partial [Anaerolineales bacterium]